MITQDVPAIIPRQSWEFAQQIRKSDRTKAPRRAKRPYLLRGMVFCGRCERRDTGYSSTWKGGRTAYYKCGRAGCNNKQVPAELVEGIVWQDIEGFVQNPRPGLEELRSQLHESESLDVQEDLVVVKGALAGIFDGRQRILTRIRKGLITEDEGDAQLEDTSRERELLEARLTNLTDQTSEKQDAQAHLSATEVLLRELISWKKPAPRIPNST